LGRYEVDRTRVTWWSQVQRPADSVTIVHLFVRT
jgi:hypothetical protein